MLELFLTTLVIFLFFMSFFYFLSLFKMMQYILFLFQLIVCFILLSNNFYKEHILWKEEEPTMIKHLSFEPLTNIEPNYNSESPRRGKGYPKGFTNSYKNSPSRNTQDDQNPGMNKYISISDYTNLDSNQKKIIDLSEIQVLKVSLGNPITLTQKKARMITKFHQ